MYLETKLVKDNIIRPYLMGLYRGVKSVDALFVSVTSLVCNFVFCTVFIDYRVCIRSRPSRISSYPLVSDVFVS
ncbi:hypothetical protein Hanom_Chr12g01071791 [Helianthus anomalus]